MNEWTEDTGKKKTIIEFNEPIEFESLSFGDQFHGMVGGCEYVPPVFNPGDEFPILEEGQFTVHDGGVYAMPLEPMKKTDGIKSVTSYIKNDSGEWEEIPNT